MESEAEELVDHEERDEIDADRAVFAGCVEWLRAHAAGPVEGVFGPDSLTWRIYREPWALLGGLRAILLQIAHPAVAAGVAAQSSFRRDPIGRAQRTFGITYAVTFADLDGALAAAERLHRRHESVRGTIPETAGGPDVGAPYRANDPELDRWVLATLVDTGLTMHERFNGLLSDGELRRYHAETTATAALFGIPAARWPATPEGFRAYFDGMLGCDVITVGELAKDLARSLFASPFAHGPFAPVIASGLLPPALRAAYGLPFGPYEDRNFRLRMAAMRALLLGMPAWLRQVPAYHQAQHRVALARGGPASWSARWGGVLDGIARSVTLPLGLRPPRGG